MYWLEFYMQLQFTKDMTLTWDTTGAEGFSSHRPFLATSNLSRDRDLECDWDLLYFVGFPICSRFLDLERCRYRSWELEWDWPRPLFPLPLSWGLRLSHRDVRFSCLSFCLRPLLSCSLLSIAAWLEPETPDVPGISASSWKNVKQHKYYTM